MQNTQKLTSTEYNKILYQKYITKLSLETMLITSQLKAPKQLHHCSLKISVSHRPIISLFIICDSTWHTETKNQYPPQKNLSSLRNTMMQWCQPNADIQSEPCYVNPVSVNLQL